MDFRTDKLLHGGDYNPEQWLKRPDILEKDIDMLEESGCNVVSLGIFSWSTLEPEEGVFHFGWLQEIIDKLYKRGISTILATPSGARPKWMADKYPEVLRVDETRHRALFGFRHNHCYTSPVYREKVHIINKKLAQEVATHPGVILWHISNEYGGECHCPLCQKAFRNWLKEKYQTIENLNDKWCTTFWSHTYNSFDQIESPSKIGETQLHALNLDWKRFVTHQTANFIHHEIAALREGGSTLTTTANLMHYFGGLDYFKIAKEIDVVSWDTYPTWHKEAVIDTAYDNGMCHDLMRSLKGKPFFQMESCPTSTNWQSVSKLKKPGMLFAQSMQAIAHGGEGALYFQIRQSRGASEKFHGAVIDHYGGNDTRVFKEVSRVGEVLKELKELAGTTVNSSVAMLYDWDSQWAMEDSQGPRNKGLHYLEAMLKFYRGFRKQGVNVDVIDMTCELDKYKVKKERCIGCTQCFNKCPKQAIEMVTQLQDYKEVLPKLIEKGIDCIEFHAISEDEQDVDEKWQQINDYFDGMLCISLDRSELGDKKLKERVKRLIAKRKPFTTIIQADGIAMTGGTDDYATTLQSVATAQLFQNENIPAYIMMSGGTNTKSTELAKQCKVQPHCLAVGSYARKIVKDYLERDDFYENKEAFNEAVKIAKNLIDTSLRNMVND